MGETRGTVPDNETRWVAAECDEAAVERLARESGVPRALARLLIARGVETPRQAQDFLNPSLDHLHDPALLPDVEVGVDRIADAMSKGEKILIHGDYDVDGVTSTALLVRTLRALKAEVEFRLPHRRKEGYDIKPSAIDEAAGMGASVVVTCDCGIGAHDTVERARELGIDVIITDHHEPGNELPPALAVINPKREDAQYPFPELAGVGVAFKFAQALVRQLGYDEEAFKSRFIDLVALGTVADVVPLLNENRALVKFGLEAIPNTKKVGLRTMLRAARLIGKPLTSYSLGFILGPRINAVGRMDDASLALRLLLTRDESEATQLAERLERCNTERRAEQERILTAAVDQVGKKDLGSARVLVLSAEGWNSGVIGIVAGKICETFNRPAILINRDEASGIGAGSARSIGKFHILDGLRRCDDLLGRYGGHALAAGLSIPLANLDEFEERINAVGFETMTDEDIEAKIIVDAELAAGEITRDLAKAISSMEPFGMGNPEPLFITRAMPVVQKQRVGDGSHLKMTLRGDGGALPCIFFGQGDLADKLELGEPVDLCYSIRLDTFNGAQSVQLVGKAIYLPS